MLWQCIPLPWKQVDFQDKKLRWGVIWEDGACEFFVTVGVMNFFGRHHTTDPSLPSSFGMGFGCTNETRARGRRLVSVSSPFNSMRQLCNVTNTPSTPPSIVEGFGIGLQLCFSDAGECPTAAYFA